MTFDKIIATYLSYSEIMPNLTISLKIYNSEYFPCFILKKITRKIANFTKLQSKSTWKYSCDFFLCICKSSDEQDET